MEVDIPKPVRCDAIQCRSRDDAPKSAGSTKANVVGEDKQDVGRAFRWHNPWSPAWFGVFGIEIYHPAECRGRGRKQLQWSWLRLENTARQLFVELSNLSP